MQIEEFCGYHKGKQRDGVFDWGRQYQPDYEFACQGFEMGYQGSRDELKDVPKEAVALLRERQVWPTPGGKWARIYIMAWGETRVVESEDNFAAWEAAHIVPPRTPGGR